MRFGRPLGPIGFEHTSEVTVTASVTPHTKGEWITLVASMAQDIMGFYFYPTAQIAFSGSDTSILIDFGVGGSGDAVEDTLIANLPVGYSQTRSRFYLPIGIRKGERLAARIQATIASDVFPMRLILGYAPPPPAWAGYARGENITPMDLAASTPTMGDFTDNAFEEIVASTSRFYRGFNYWGAIVGSNGNSNDALIDLAVGGAGVEQIIGSWTIRTINSENLEGWMGPLWIERPAPAGSRLSVRKNMVGNQTGAFAGYW